jgi:NAD+ diphosphatase
MLGFTADYAAGEIKIDEIEIEDARWYSVDNLPQLPPKISIARRMIDSFVDHQKKRA